MLYAGICSLELLVLFFLSRSVTRNVSFLLFRLTHSKKLTVYMLAFFFLPGTVVHELAHFFMAKLLFVYAGHIHLLPHLEGTQVKLGSVQVGKTDPVRRFLIGVAPFLCGTTLILAAVFALIYFQQTANLWWLLGLAYLLCEIGNTMFSSPKDMEGALGLVILLGFVIGVLLLLKVPVISFVVTWLQTPTLGPLWQMGALFLALPLVLDILLIAVVRLFHRLLSL